MEFNNHELIITYKRIKRLNARIRDNKILVSAPYFTKDEVIFKFLDSNKEKIEKMFNNVVNTDPNVIYVWGKKYNICKIEGNENKVVLMEDI
nr:M48 family metallopeptidase [bacterium]